MPKTDYELKIDDKDVEKSLKDTQDQFDKMGKAGDDAMKKVGKSAEELGDGIRRNVNGRLIDASGKFVSMGKSGDDAMKKVSRSGLSMSHVLSGAVGGALVTLTGAALEFGKAAVRAFADAIKSSTQAAIKFDITRKKFISIFEGQEGAADAVMEKISKKASELGLDMNEALSISRTFLSDVKGTEDPLGAIENLLVGVRALGEEDPAQGIIGARIAIDEAMSGSLRSLKQRFEFTKAEIDILKAAQEEFGEVVGTIEGINKVMARRGVDVEALKGTFTQALGEMQFATGKLRVELGKPIADQMTESMTDLNKIMAENSDDLELMAAAVGDLVAEIVDFVGTGLTEYLSTIDFSQLEELGIVLQQALAAAELVVDVLFEVPEAGAGIESVTQGVKKLRNAMVIVAQTAEKLKLALEGTILAAKAAFQIKKGDVAGAFETAKQFGELFDPEHIKQSQKESEVAFDRFAAKIKEIKEVTEGRKKAQDADTVGALAGAEAYLKQGDAASETAKALAELGLAEEDLGKIQADVIKTQEKLLEAADNFVQQRLDIDREFSQERADLIRDSLLDIAAIELDHQQAIIDQGIELGRDVQDMAKKHSQERIGSEKDLRQDLLDVEQNYQDELRRIQKTMEEAERGLDTQAFVAALRQQEEAAITREGAEADVRDEASQRLKDLEQAQAEERATLQQADRDKLDDLNLRLQREFEDQALADQLALEQQVIDEERRMEQQMISEQRKLDSLIQAQAERLAKMVEGLDEETAAVILAEANKLAAIEDFAGSAQAVLDGLIANVKKKVEEVKRPVPSPRPEPGQPRLGGEEEGAGYVPPRLFLPIVQKRFGGGVREGRIYRVGEAGLEGYIPHRGLGGGTRIGQPTIIGEFGEELFIPPSSGTIIPNNQMGSFLGDTSNIQQSISNTQNNLGGFTVSQSMLEDPIQRSQLENFVVDVMSRN